MPNVRAMRSEIGNSLSHQLTLQLRVSSRWEITLYPFALVTLIIRESTRGRFFANCVHVTLVGSFMVISTRWSNIHLPQASKTFNFIESRMTNEKEATLRKWLLANSHIFVTQETGRVLHLTEVATAKQIALDLNSVEAMEYKADSITGAHYCVLLLENGHQLVLCQQGFAFAPDFRSTGPIELPSTVFCMTDFNHFYGQLKHNAIEHPEDRRRSTDLVLLSIALLEGARNVGIDVDFETKRVERILEAIEKETVPECS